MRRPNLKFYNQIFWVAIFIIYNFVTVAKADNTPTKGVLNELKLNSDNEDENVKKAATTEALITKTEENALKDVDKLLKKYKGTQQEPDLLFRKAELYVRRAKSGRFFDLYRGEKSLDQILKPELKQKGAKDYLKESIKIYSGIQKDFPKYNFMDEVLFNQAFAYQQMGDSKNAEALYKKLLNQYPKSQLIWETHMAFGELLFLDQKYDEAIKQFIEIEKIPESPLYPLAFYKRAWCHYNLHETDDGIKYLEKVLELSQKAGATKHLRNESRRDLGLFYTDSRKAEDALKYFKKLLSVEEMATTFVEMSDLLNRHGNYVDSVTLLTSFINEYPDEKERIIVQMKLLDLMHENKKENDLIISMKQLHQLCLKTKSEFCAGKLKIFENNILAEWWEKWNKNRENKIYLGFCKDLFPMFFNFENKENIDPEMHFGYAEVVFDSKDYVTASQQYDLVTHHEKVDPEQKHKALYSAIVSYSEVKAATPKKDYKEANLIYLHKLLTEYMQLYPKGVFYSQVQYQKAFLHFENKEWDDAEKYFLALQKSSNIELKEKSEDLLFDIYNKKEEYEKLKSFSFIVYTNSVNERKEKIKQIYQQSELKLIELLLKKGKEAEAANGYISFHNEHKPSEIASKALEEAIPLFFKNNLYEEGAVSAEKRAGELTDPKKLQMRCEFLNKSIQAWLFIGQIENALNTTLLVSEIQTDLKKQKEALLLAENLSQLTEDQKAIFKIWEKLPKFLDSNEQETFFLVQKKYFDAHPDLSETKDFYKKIESQKIEPFYSEIQLKKALELFNKQKYTEVFQLSKTIQNANTTAQIKSQARLLQAQVLEIEFEKQSIKAQGDRIPLVLAIKTEKMDKAITAYTSALSMTPVISEKITILNYINRSYSHYVTTIEGFLKNEDQAVDPELKQQLIQVVTVMKSKSDETLQTITQLDSQVKEDAKLKSNSTIKVPQIAFNEFNLDWPGQNLFHIYLPSWNENQSQNNWTDLIDVSANAKNCTAESIQNIKSETMLGLKIHQCLKLHNKNEIISLTNTFLKKYPLSPWGAFYRAIHLYESGHKTASLWYLELAIKKDPKAQLVYYEKARETMKDDLSEVIAIWKQQFNNDSSDFEEARLLKGIFSYEKEGCTKVPQYFENIHRPELNNYIPKILILSECYSKNQRVSEAVSLLENSLKKQTSVLILIQRAKIAELFEKQWAVAIKYYEKAKIISDSEDIKKSLENKIKELSTRSSTSNRGSLKEESHENKTRANNHSS